MLSKTDARFRRHTGIGLKNLNKKYNISNQLYFSSKA